MKPHWKNINIVRPEVNILRVYLPDERTLRMQVSNWYFYQYLLTIFPSDNFPTELILILADQDRINLFDTAYRTFYDL